MSQYGLSEQFWHRLRKALLSFSASSSFLPDSKNFLNTSSFIALYITRSRVRGLYYMPASDQLHSIRVTASDCGAAHPFQLRQVWQIKNSLPTLVT